MTVSKEKFREAMVVVDTYCQQITIHKNATEKCVGAIVELSKWGKEMQTNHKKKTSGKIVDFIRGVYRNDGTVCIKWDGIKKPVWMHEGQCDIKIQ